MKKTVKISDEAYLKSIKDFFKKKQIDIAGEMEFLVENESMIMRLSDLKTTLGNFGVF